MSGWFGAKPMVPEGRNRAPRIGLDEPPVPLNVIERDPGPRWAWGWANRRPQMERHGAAEPGVHADCPSCQAQVWAVAS